MPDLPNLSKIEGFEWDQANIQKNWQRHKAAFYECEEVFFREPLIFEDLKHSKIEPRFFALGNTMRGRFMTIVFTIRKNNIRIISGRDMSRKERSVYVKTQEDPQI